MPLNTYQLSNQDSWDAIQLRLFSSAGVYDGPLWQFTYQYIFWYPIFQLTNVPLSVSRDLRSYGNKHYLGEVAYLNFGNVVHTEYLQYERQQGKFCLALPVPVFDSNNTEQSGQINNWISSTNALRSRSLAWDLVSGVSIELSIAWQFGFFHYNPEQHAIQII